jgi:hypothetical protein
MKQDPNLFDAFQRVDSKRTSSEATPVAAAKPKAIGLVMPAVDMKWLFGGGAALLILSIFFIGFFLGRATDQDAQAKGPSDGEFSTEVGTSHKGPQGTPGGSPEGSKATTVPTNVETGDYSPVSDSRGLYKSTNRFTVLAITYTDQPSLESRAKEIAEYLRAQGFPAFDPVGRNGSIEILVGATPTRGELSAILSRLRVTKGPNGKSYDFETAYIDNIDNHTDR